MIQGHEYGGALVEMSAAVAKARVTQAVTDFVVARARHWAGRGRPVQPGILVADVEGLSMRVDDRVVVPRSEAVLAAVLSKGMHCAGFGDDAPGVVGVGEHVGPGQRGIPKRAVRLFRQADDILGAVRVEAAVAVLEIKQLCTVARRIGANRTGVRAGDGGGGADGLRREGRHGGPLHLIQQGRGRVPVFGQTEHEQHVRLRAGGEFEHRAQAQAGVKHIARVAGQRFPQHCPRRGQ